MPTKAYHGEIEDVVEALKPSLTSSTWLKYPESKRASAVPATIAIHKGLIRRLFAFQENLWFPKDILRKSFDVAGKWARGQWPNAVNDEDWDKWCEVQETRLRLMLKHVTKAGNPGQGRTVAKWYNELELHGTGGSDAQQSPGDAGSDSPEVDGDPASKRPRLEPHPQCTEAKEATLLSDLVYGYDHYTHTAWRCIDGQWKEKQRVKVVAAPEAADEAFPKANFPEFAFKAVRAPAEERDVKDLTIAEMRERDDCQWESRRGAWFSGERTTKKGDKSLIEIFKRSSGEILAVIETPLGTKKSNRATRRGQCRTIGKGITQMSQGSLVLCLQGRPRIPSKRNHPRRLEEGIKRREKQN